MGLEGTHCLQPCFSLPPTHATYSVGFSVGLRVPSLSLSIIASVTHHLYLSLPTPSCSLSFCLSPCLSRARIIVDRIQYVFGFDMFSPSSSTSSLTLSPSPILRHELKALLHNPHISSPVCTSDFKRVFCCLATSPFPLYMSIYVTLSQTLLNIFDVKEYSATRSSF